MSPLGLPGRLPNAKSNEMMLNGKREVSTSLLAAENDYRT
jgi:hypothetical protein